MQENHITDSAPELPIKTYADLEAAYIEHLQSKNKSEQELKNARSLLNTWQQCFKSDKSSPVGARFGEKFSESLDKYRLSQAKSGARNSTVASKITHLRKINRFLTQRISLENLPDTFGQRLKQILLDKGYSNRKFWSLYLKDKCSVDNLNHWCAEKTIPHPKFRGLVAEIERFLELPEKTLSSLLRPPALRAGFAGGKNPRKQSSFGKKMTEARAKPYSVWEDCLEEELRDLTAFKTEPVLPRGLERLDSAMWTSSDGHEFPSANLMRNSMKVFFGYLCLPVISDDPMLRGLGYAKDKLTLGLLTDMNAVEKYVTEFMKARSGGKYNRGHIRFLGTVASLLRPGTGYLYQKPEFAAKLGMSVDKKMWQKHCVATRNRALDILQDIKRAEKIGSNTFAKGRDPEEPITDILALPDPYAALAQFLGKMLKDVETFTSDIRQAIFFRDLVLIAMLMANPLRIKMFSEMKFGENLIRRDDGSWWIYFGRNSFKNRKAIPKDYLVRVAPELIPLIERYQKEFRPQLFGANECEYVFLRQNIGDRQSSKSSDIYRFAEKDLSFCVRSRTGDYFPESPGFGPHSFRHITATSIIKNNPETGFFLASKVLHDKLETVEANYAHLKTSEFFEPFNRYVSGYLGGMIDAFGKGISSAARAGGGSQ